MSHRIAGFFVVLSFLLWVGEARGGDAEGGWEEMFDGKTLSGWKVAEHAGSFKVVDGAIVCQGPRAHMFYAGPIRGAEFKNFELGMEVMTRPGANSGVYFHTSYQESDWPRRGFEVQINNTHHGEGGYRELKKTGSLYGIRNLYKAPVDDNEWFRLEIVVRANHVVVRVNGMKVVDYVEAEGSDAGSGTARLGSGTFALQCHDPGSVVYFRGLRVRPLADALPAERVEPLVGVPFYGRLVSLHGGNVPVMDLHVHLKGGLTIEEVLGRFYGTGINYGVAVNGGIGFPITNDAGIRAFREELGGHPVFVALQAEGREWRELFSREAIERFDYVFTDAMTFTDDRGKRTRLWIRDEVEVGDPSAFMEMYVSRIVDILENEPIDVFVNATFLPEVLEADYDRLWTPARMQKVIDAAVGMGIAIEINDRYRIPSVAFVRLAKKAGAKFTFGTNNGGRRDLGYLEYCLDVQRECGLTSDDFYVPGWQRSRAASVR